MFFLYVTLLIPVLGILLMLHIGERRSAGLLNILLNGIGFCASLGAAWRLVSTNFLISPHGLWYVDSFSILFIVLTTFIATTTAIFSHEFMWSQVKAEKISPQKLKLYHVLYQIFILMVLVTLATNNIGIIWVAMEGATLATILLVSLYRTPQAIEAAWKYFILCIVGIALALFGTILVYASADSFNDVSSSAILWNFLYEHARNLNPNIIKLAFVFLLIGYGTKMGLVPLHNWLPDAYSESPAPVSVLLSGLLSTVALYALIRFKILVDLALQNHLAGNLMIGFGMVSLLVASILLHRQHNLKRLFSYSSIQHMGVMTFAFGIGGAFATFGALFYMLMHALVKSAIFINIGNITRIAGTQALEKLHGFLKRQPVVGWCLLLATVAICGLPPFGIFISEFFVVLATLKTAPILAVFLVVGLVIALSGLFRNLQPVLYGDSKVSQSPCCYQSIFATVLHLCLVLMLGIYIPPLLAQFLQRAVQLIAH